MIEEIRRLGYILKVSAYRPTDRKMSSKSFEFRYQPHLGEHCVFCAYLCSRNDAKQLPVAKPGVQRRVADLVQGEDWDKGNKAHPGSRIASSSVHDQFEVSQVGRCMGGRRQAGASRRSTRNWSIGVCSQGTHWT